MYSLNPLGTSGEENNLKTMDSQQNVENRETLKQMLESAWAAKAAGLLMIDVASLCEIGRSVFKLVYEVTVIFLSVIIIILF